MQLSITDKLAAARILASRKLAPYFAPALYRLIWLAVPGLGTLGISQKYIVGFDPAFIESLTVEQIAWILLHEIAHPLKRHSARLPEGADPSEWNDAADREINHGLVTMGWTANLWPFQICMPADIGMADGLLAEEYLAKVKADQASAPQPQDDSSQDDSSQGEPGDDGQGSPQDDGQPQDGPAGEPGDDGQGAPQDGAPGQGSGTGEPGDAGAGAGQGEPQAGKPAAPGAGACGAGAGNPQGWEAAADADIDRTSADLENVRREVAAKIQAAAQSSDSLGAAGLGAWLEWADDVIEPPKVRWQDKLRRVVTSRVRQGGNKSTFTRRSKRQAGLAQGRRTPVLAGRRTPVPKVWVCFDTSGSMGKDAAAAGLAELNGIARTLRCDVTFLTIDTQVHTCKPVRDWQEAARNLKGGGGTRLRPALDLAEANRRDVDLLVFLTDGHVRPGDIPQQAPKGIKVVWLLAGNNPQRPADWGDCIEITD